MIQVRFYLKLGELVSAKKCTQAYDTLKSLAGHIPMTFPVVTTAFSLSLPVSRARERRQLGFQVFHGESRKIPWKMVSHLVT